MQNITFCRPTGTRKFCKRYYDKHTEPYPLVRNLSSSTHPISIDLEGLRKKVALYRQHAAAGDALLKGTFDKDLRNESRTGHTNKDEKTRSLVIDIDDFAVPENEFVLGVGPLTQNHLRHACEYIVGKLPERFHHVSYIGHASSSLGTKEGLISVHLEFWLRDPVSPKALKNMLFNLNYSIEAFRDQLELSATGTALRYTIDPCLADNSRLIYIAPPEFMEGRHDPFRDPEQRFVCVEKTSNTVDVRPLIADASPERLTQAKKRIIRDLRGSQGLPRKDEKTASLKFQGNFIKIVTNPDAVALEYAYHTDEYVYYNLHTYDHRGDSNAYYVRRDNPEIVFNFKNEPFFRFKDVDNDAYEQHCEQFVNESDFGETRYRPLVFRDFRADCYFNALVDRTESKLVEVAEAKRSALDEFMQQHGDLTPDVIETVDFVFNPTDDRTIDMEASPRPFINKFFKSDYMASEELTIDYKRIGDVIRARCPAIYTLIDSVTGNDEECTRTFLHWLAFVLQTRQKSQIAWVFQGTFGTGKGLLANKVITPLFSERYTKHLRLCDLDEKFNAWAEDALFAVVDEFAIGNAKRGEDLMNSLKNLITEPTISIRAMRQNKREIANYTNYVFFSNQYEILTLQEGDRRFNVCPRQEKPLKEVVKDITSFLRQLPNELPLFAELLNQVEYEQAVVQSPIMTEAKQQMIEVSKNTVDHFVAAVRTGNIDYFTEVLDVSASTGNEYVHPAKLIVKSWIKNNEKVSLIWLQELLTLYNAIIGKCDSDRKLSKMFRARGMEPGQIKRNGLNRRGFQVQWRYSDNTREDLIDAYFTDDELQFGSEAANDTNAPVADKGKKQPLFN